MREHSVHLYRFRIISLDRKRAASGIVVRFTKSDEKVCSYKNRWAAAVSELLKCSRQPTNTTARYAVAVIKEGMTISHHLIANCPQRRKFFILE